MHRIESYRYLPFISMLFLTAILSCYLLAYKMVMIGGLIEPGSIFFIPIVYALADITTEVYGCNYTKKLLQQAFYCCFIFCTAIPLIILLPQAQQLFPQQDHFILSNLFRLFAASTIGLMVGLTVNNYLICRWQLLLGGKLFWLRSIGATAIGLLPISLITDSITYAGILGFWSMIKLMMALYVAKVVFTILLAWPSALLAMHLRVKERVNLTPQVNPFMRKK